MHLFCTIDLLVHNYTAYADLCQPDMVVQMFPRVIWWLDILFVLSFFLQVLVFSLSSHRVFYVGCQVGPFCVCKHSEIHPVSAHCKCCCSCDQCRCSCVFWWCSFKYRAGFSSSLFQSFFTFWNHLFHITFLKHVWLGIQSTCNRG